MVSLVLLFLATLELCTSKKHLVKAGTSARCIRKTDCSQSFVWPGKWFVDSSKDAGLQTSEFMRFYAISKFPAFINKDNPLVIKSQLSGYIKILQMT